MAIKTPDGASNGKNLSKNEKIISKQKVSELSPADLFAFRTYFTEIYDDRKKALAVVKEIRKRIDNIFFNHLNFNI